MSLYLWLNILTISIPLLLSFDKKVHFHTHWKFFFPAMLITMAIFISWDVIFTRFGVWGFNEVYHSGRTFLGIPLEEYLFFISVPYATVFTLYVVEYYFTGMRLNEFQVRLVSLILIACLLITAILNMNKAYTAVSFILTAGILGLVLLTKPVLLRQFYFGYLLILLPFLIMNGILTGSFIEDQVVWYNDQENLGIRLGTIPVEDVFYGMSLILLNYYLTEIFRMFAKKEKIIIKK
jgi:lycopene cyclase domain-containing protein